MRKFCLAIIWISLFFVSCSYMDLLNDSNKDEYTDIAEKLLNDKEVLFIKRNIDGNKEIIAKDHIGHLVNPNKQYLDFFKNNKTVGSITRIKRNLNDIYDPDALESYEILAKEKLAKEKIRNRIGDAENVTFISLREFYNFIFFCSMDTIQYVYSPNLDFSELAEDELSIFGFARATKLEIENWYYINPLG